MTFFVILMYTIVLIVGAGILVYNIYTIYEMQEEFKNNPAKDVFMKYYHQIRKERLTQWTTSSDSE